MGIAFKWAKEFHPATEEEASKAAKTRTSSWHSASMRSKSNLDRIANALSWICSPSNPGRPSCTTTWPSSSKRCSRFPAYRLAPDTRGAAIIDERALGAGRFRDAVWAWPAILVSAGEHVIQWTSQIPSGGTYLIPTTASRSSFEHMLVVREAASWIEHCQAANANGIFVSASIHVDNSRMPGGDANHFWGNSAARLVRIVLNVLTDSSRRQHTARR